MIDQYSWASTLLTKSHKQDNGIGTKEGKDSFNLLKTLVFIFCIE